MVALREHRKASEWPGNEDLVFPAGDGSPLRPGNLNRRVLQPAREEADLSWVGFHTLRHTCATLLFKEGRNAVQVQRWLGHHSPSFTLNTYTHLLEGNLGAPWTCGVAIKWQYAPRHPTPPRWRRWRKTSRSRANPRPRRPSTTPRGMSHNLRVGGSSPSSGTRRNPRKRGGFVVWGQRSQGRNRLVGPPPGPPAAARGLPPPCVVA